MTAIICTRVVLGSVSMTTGGAAKMRSCARRVASGPTGVSVAYWRPCWARRGKKKGKRRLYNASVSFVLLPSCIFSSCWLARHSSPVEHLGGVPRVPRWLLHWDPTATGRSVTLDLVRLVGLVSQTGRGDTLLRYRSIIYTSSYSNLTI